MSWELLYPRRIGDYLTGEPNKRYFAAILRIIVFQGLLAFLGVKHVNKKIHIFRSLSHGRSILESDQKDNQIQISPSETI
ncbi:MAG: hypothetical protein WA364_12750 [Candidatus Nitrosopolaris sp.]